MSPSPAVLFLIVILGAVLSSPRLRAYLTHIALLRFFDRHMSQPRYRLLLPEESREESTNEAKTDRD